jgi:hypothetical protein
MEQRLVISLLLVGREPQVSIPHHTVAAVGGLLVPRVLVVRHLAQLLEQVTVLPHGWMVTQPEVVTAVLEELLQVVLDNRELLMVAVPAVV